MGVINETLRLTDGFSASFRMFEQMGNRAISVTASLDNSVTDLLNQNSATTVNAIGQVGSEVSWTNQILVQASNSAAVLNKNLTRAMGRSAGATIGALRVISGQAQETNKILQEILKNQTGIKEKTEDTSKAASKWLSRIRTVAATLGAAALTKAFANTADEMSQIEAKLNLINDGQQTTAQLQDMIYASAQRSRGAYQDTANLVARIGMNAKEAFGSNAEMIQFAENLNKQFVIAGASQAEMGAATLQLTQALGAGVLRGEELNSVFESAPSVIQNIADYIERDNELLTQMADKLDMKPEKLSGNVKKYIRDMASEGLLSAEIVKNALLSATDEINENFEAMPMTLAQAFTKGKNAIQKSLQESFSGWSDFLNSDEGQEALTRMINLFSVLAQVGVGALSAVGKGTLWVSENLDFLIPILGAVAVAYGITKAEAIKASAASALGAAKAASEWSRTAVASAFGAAKSGAAWAMAAAANVLGAIKAGTAWRNVSAANVMAALKAAGAWTLAQLPLLLIISLVAAAIGYVVSLGLTFQDVGSFVGAVLGVLYAVGYNVFASLWNLIATFAEFFANVFNDPVSAITHLFQGLFDFIFSIVESVAGAIDTILGTNMAGAVAGFRGWMSDFTDAVYGENAVQIKRMSMLNVADTSAQFSEAGANFGSKLDNLNFNLESITEGLGGLDTSALSFSGFGDELGDIGKVGSVGSVKNVEGDIRLSDEDLKVYQDLAERRYMNQIELKTLAPEINITIPGANGDKADAKKIGDYLKKVLIEQMNSQTSIAHG